MKSLNSTPTSMKTSAPRRTTRRILTGSIAAACAVALLGSTAAQAVTYYWDNLAGAGFGTAGGTWSATTTGPTPGWTTDATGAAVPGSVATATTDAINFGTGTAGQGLAAGTITVGTVNAGDITFGSQSGAIILSGGTITLAAAETITVNNAADTINSILAGAATSLTKTGTGTLTLSGVNTYTGATNINQGAIVISGTGVIANTATNAININNTGTLTMGRTDTWGSSATGAPLMTITIAAGGTMTNQATFFNTLGAINLNGGTLTSAGGNSATFGSWALRGTVTVGGSAASTISQAGTNAQINLGAGTVTGTTFNVADATGNANTDLLVSAVLQNGANGSNVAQASSLTKSGVGTMTLSGTNAYTGGTTLSAGTLIANNATALGTVASALKLNGGTLDLQTGGTAYLTTVGGNTTIQSDKASSSAGVTWTLGTLSIGAFTLNVAPGANATGSTAGITFGATTISGTSSAATFSPALNSTLTLGTVTGTTPTITMSGTGSLVFSGTILTATSLTISNGSVTMNTNNSTTQAALTVNSPGVLNFNNGQIFGVLNGNGTINQNTNQLYTNSTANGAFSGTINGSGGYVKQNTGTETLSGLSTYTGQTLLSTGTLSINTIKDVSGGNSALGAPTSAATGLIVMGATTTTGTLLYTGALQSTNRTIQIGNNSGAPVVGDTGGAIIQNDGAGALTFSAATLNSPTNAASGTSPTRTLTLQGSNTGANTISGIIQNNQIAGSPTAAVAVAKAGAGTWVLAGNNSYTGATTLTVGILSIGHANALGGTTNGTTQSGASELRISGGITTAAEPLSINGGGISNAGALRNFSGDNTYAGTVTMAAQSRINSDSGTLTLSNATAVTGAAQNLVVGGAGNITISGAITTTTGFVSYDGTGTLTLSGANTYSGATSKSNGGTLKLDYGTNDTTKLADAAVLTLGGGTIELAGGTHTEVVGSTTLTAATANTITQTSGGATLALNTITPGAGAALNLTANNLATTDNLNAGGILGFWATVTTGGLTTWAANFTNLADGLIIAAPFTDVDRLGGLVLHNADSQVRIIDAGASGNITLNTAPLTQVNTLRMSATGGPATIAPTAATDVFMVGGEAGTFITQDSGAGSLTIGASANNGVLTTGGTANATPATIGFINNSAGNSLVINSTIADNGTDVVSLSKTGVGKLVLGGANTFTGAVAVSAGSLVIGNATALSSANALTLSGTSTVDLNGFSVTVGGTATGVAGNTITNSSSAVTASTATTSGTPSGVGVYVDALNITGAQTANIAALITDGATRKTQIIVLNGNGSFTTGNTANSFTGGLVLADGTGAGTRLTISAPVTGTPYGTGPIILGQSALDNATIYFNGTATGLSNPLIFNTALGTDRVGIRSDVGGITLSGSISANLADATFSTNTGAGAFNLTGKVTGSFGLALDMAFGTAMTVTLNNSGTPNDFAGATTINANAGAGRSSTLVLGAANQIPNGVGKGNVTINTVSTGIGTLNLASFSETINGLNGSGTVGSTSGTPTLTVGDGDAAGSFSGIIQNTGSTLALTKIGSGTQILSGPSTYAGLTTVNGGTLSFATSANLGNAAATNGVTLGGGTLQYTGAGTVGLGALRQVTVTSGTTGTIEVQGGLGNLQITAGGIITTGASAATNFTKSGPGTLTVTGAVDLQTGGVTVTGGTLTAGLHATNTGTINVGASGSLQLVDSSAVTLTLAGTATGALNLSGGARLGFELDATTVNDSITMTGANSATAGGVITLDFYALGGFGPGSYTLLTAPGGLNGATYVLGNAPSGFNYVISPDLVNGTFVNLTTSVLSTRYWTNSQTGGSWNTITGGPLSNFSTDLAGISNSTQIPQTANTVIFSSSNGSVGVSPINTTLDANFTVDSLSFTAQPANATVSIAPGGAFALTLSPVSTANGIAVASSGGAVDISAPLTAGATQTWSVDGTGTSSLTLSGNVTYTGNVTKTGAGALTLTGAANSGAGSFTLAGGTLNANSNGALGTGTFIIGNGTTLENSSAGLVTLTGGANVWNGNFTYTGATQSLDLGAGAVTLTASLQATVSGQTLTVGGAVGDGAGTFGLTKAGAGTLVLNGNNTYDGTTTVSAGTLTLGGNNTLGGAVTVNAGTANLTGTNAIGALVTVSGGILNLNGANMGAGGVTLASGTLNLNNDAALGTGTLTLSGGTIESPIANRATTNNNAQTWTNGATVVFTGAFALDLGTGAVTLGADASVATFTLTNNNSALSGTTLTVGGNITSGAGGVAGVKTLVINGTNSGTTLLTGTLSAGAATGLVVTNSLSAGTLHLSGTSTIRTLNITATGGIVNLTGGNLSLANAGASSVLASNNATINGGTITLTSGTAGTATTLQNYGDVGATAGTLTINSVIAGAAGIGVDFIPAAGTVVLNGTNTFSGPAGIFSNVSVSSIGNIGVPGNLGTGATLGTNPSAINLGSATNAGTLIYTGTGEVTNKALSLGATTATSTLDMSGTGTLQFSATGNIVSNGAGAKILALRGSTAGIGQLDQNIVNATNGGAAVSVSKSGTGTWVLTGTNTYTGTTTVTGGTLVAAASASSTTGNIIVGNTTANAVLNVTGTMTGGTITAGSGANSFGAVNVTGGTLTLATPESTDAISFGSGEGGYGAFTISSGAFTQQRFMFGGIGGSATGGTGVGLITGGTVNSAGWIIISRAGASTGVVTITGGTLNHGSASQDIAIGLGGTGRAELNVAGGLIDNTGRRVTFAAGTGGGFHWSGTGIVNLNAGTLLTNSFNYDTLTSPFSPNASSYINFSGGRLKASSASATFLPAYTPSGTGTNRVFVNGAFGTFVGGAVIDTNGFDNTISANLLAPTGNGVTGLSIDNAGSGYIGAPYVNILDGGLPSTATGYAIVGTDSTNLATFGKVTSVVITNPGAITGAATVSLVGGGGSGAAISVASTGANTSGGLTKDGIGTLTLSGTNTYTGVTTINNSLLSITNASALGGTANGTVVNSGGSLTANGLTITGESLSLNGTGGGAGNGALYVGGSQTTTWAGPITLAGNTKIHADGGSAFNFTAAATINLGAFTLNFDSGNSANSTFGGVISGSGGISKTLSTVGALILSAANSYTGATTLSAGVLQLSNVSALGGNNPGVNGTSGISMVSGTTIQTNITGVTISAPMTLSGVGDATLQAGLNTGSTTNLNGAIGGATGNVVYTTATNSFGNQSSIFVLGAAGTYTGNTLITSGNGANNPVILRNGVVNALPTTTVLTLDGGTGGGTGRSITYDLLGNNQTLAGLTNVMSLSLRNHRVTSTAAAELTINNTANFTFGGAVTTSSTSNSLITGAISLTKNGTGTFTLGGTLVGGAAAPGNTFTGATKILGGILVLGETISAQNSAFDTTNSVVGDATNGLRITPTTLTLGGLTGANDFSTRFTSTSGGYGGLTALTLNPGTGVNHSYAADIGDGAGGMTLTKTGAGIQTFTAANTHTGVTAISVGGLVVAANGALGTIAGNTTVTAGASLGLSGGITYSTAEGITGSGTGIATAQGVFANVQRGFIQSVSGSNTFAGDITVTAASRIGTQEGASLTLTGVITQTTGNILFRSGSVTGDFVTLSNSGNTFGGDSTVFNGATGIAGNYAGVRLGVTNGLPTNRTIAGFAGSTAGTALDLNGKDQSLNGLTNGGSFVIINQDIATPSILTLNPTADQTTTATTILGGGGLGVISLVKDGAFKQTLGGINSYTGATTISAGTLEVTGGAAIANTGAVSIASVAGATLLVSASETIGSLSGGSGANGAVTLVANTLTVGDASTTTFGGTITGTLTTGTLVKQGAGVLNLATTAVLGFDTLTATGGTTNVNSALGTGTGTGVVGVSGAGTKLRFGSVSQTLSSLTIGAGSTVVFTSGTATGAFSGGGGKSAALGGGSAVVPEPGTLGLLLLGALGMLNRRRRQA